MISLYNSLHLCIIVNIGQQASFGAASMPKVSVALCTYKRTELLKRCLERLLHQKVSLSYEIVVTDNDKQESARSVVQAFIDESPGGPVNISYAVEPEQNIAAARNHCIARCTGDYVASIDDDEYPADDWLEQLLAAAVQTEAAVVIGPAHPEFPEDFPRWLQKSRIFAAPSHENGTPVYGGCTGNCLFRRAELSRRPGPFDVKLGRTGGEDTEFFRWLADAGVRMVWWNDAKVYEYQPLERAKLGWHVRRGYRTGWSRSYVKHQHVCTLAVAASSLTQVLKIPSLLKKSLKEAGTPRAAFYLLTRGFAEICGRIGYWLRLNIIEYSEK